MKMTVVFSSILLITFLYPGHNAQIQGFSRSKVKKLPSVSVSGDVEPSRIVFKLKASEFAAHPGSLDPSTVENAFVGSGFHLESIQPVLQSRRQKAPAPDDPVGRIFFATIASGHSLQAVAEQLRGRPDVEYAEPLYRHRLSEQPNDSRFGEQSYFDIINMETAWGVVKGSSGDIVVAVVDGGTDIDHEDLAANLWVNSSEIPGNKQDDDGNGFIDDIHGWNFLEAGPDATGSARLPGSANHGTNTAGIACAVTNNNLGVAGTSWNAKLMAINAADATDDLVISAEFAYTGILYAAQNGADIINLSWSRNGGPPSLFEQDVLQFARDSGCAIVAAAGNENTTIPSYPASYNTVLSVAATNASDVKSGFSNFGRTVSMAAPGESILSTFNNNGYNAFGGGTSFSAPMVAGVVALVRTFRPDMTGTQAAEQVRVTADNIDEMNPTAAGLLGSGRLNAARALTDFGVPAVRLTDLTILDSGGDGVVDAGETVEIEASFINYLSPATLIGLTLTSKDPLVIMIDDTGEIPRLGTLERTASPLRFVFDVSGETPVGRQLDFSLEIASGSYRDREYFSVQVEPPFTVLNVNNIETTVTNVGTFGFADLAAQSGGFGFNFLRSINLLFEGSMIMGTGPERISNSARAFSTTFFSKDFSQKDDGALQTLTPGRLTQQESFVVLEDDKAGAPMGLVITQETFAESAVPNDDFVILRYQVENGGPEALDDFRFGLLFDWDIGDELDDSARYIVEKRLVYAWDRELYVGTALLGDALASFRILDNQDTEFDFNDTFTDLEKWQTISGSVPPLELLRRDVAYVIATGPFSMLPGESVEIGFAMLGGESVADIEANAGAAQALWQTRLVTSVRDPQPADVPGRFSLAQNYPNPFNPETQISFELPDTRTVSLAIYNLVGEKVRTLLTGELPGGQHSVRWDGRDDSGKKAVSGVYIYRIRAGNFRDTKKLTLLR